MFPRVRRKIVSENSTIVTSSSYGQIFKDQLTGSLHVILDKEINLRDYVIMEVITKDSDINIELIQ